MVSGKVLFNELELKTGGVPRSLSETLKGVAGLGLSLTKADLYQQLWYFT